MSTFHFYSTHRFFLALFCAFVLCSQTKSSDEKDILIWRGRIVYYSGEREMSLQDAQKECEDLGGYLPSIYSKNENFELTKLAGKFRVWSSAQIRGRAWSRYYVWKDGSTVDNQMIRNESICDTSCCGLILGHYTGDLVQASCSLLSSMLCFLPTLTNKSVDFWYNTQLKIINETANGTLDSRAMSDLKQQLPVNELNATISNLQLRTSAMYTRDDGLGDYFMGPLRIWRGKLVYYGMMYHGLENTRETCDRLGGYLPSVHSRQDVVEISKLTHSLDYLWLGAEQDKSLSIGSIKSYKWTDGSAFDFNEWKEGATCTASCCGVGLTYPDPFGRRLVTFPCFSRNNMICISSIKVPSTTTGVFFNPPSGSLSGSLNVAMSSHLTNRMPSGLLDEGLRRIFNEIEAQHTHLKNDIITLFESVSSSLVICENQLKRFMNETFQCLNTNHG